MAALAPTGRKTGIEQDEIIFAQEPVYRNGEHPDVSSSSINSTQFWDRGQIESDDLADTTFSNFIPHQAFKIIALCVITGQIAQAVQRSSGICKSILMLHAPSIKS